MNFLCEVIIGSEKGTVDNRHSSSDVKFHKLLVNSFIPTQDSSCHFVTYFQSQTVNISFLVKAHPIAKSTVSVFSTRVVTNTETVNLFQHHGMGSCCEHCHLQTILAVGLDQELCYLVGNCES